MGGCHRRSLEWLYSSLSPKATGVEAAILMWVLMPPPARPSTPAPSAPEAPAAPAAPSGQ